MNSLAEWRRKLQMQVQVELTEMEQDQLWWETVTLSGPMALMDYYSRHRIRSRGGSRPGKAANVDRERQEGYERIWKDYFREQPVYNDVKFRRRFRMRKHLFWKIHDAVCEYDTYFLQKHDAANVLGLSSIQKMTAALRMLSLGISADAVDEYCRIGETTAMESLKRFVRAIRAVFEGEYLRQPTREDMEKQLKINEDRGFPGMFASLDCMHYLWKNCPVAWQGLFINKDGEKSIVLEAIADQSLWIWHAYFGLPGANNDLNVLDRSPLVNNFLRSEAHEMGFTVNGRKYDRYYLLTDSIYPDWSIFVPTILLPQGEARKWFSKCQEGARKDVERAFGVLQARFAIIRNPARIHNVQTIKDICLACVVLHNMIVQDERLEQLPEEWDQGSRHSRRSGEGRRLPTTDWKQYLAITRIIEDSSVHFMLRNDLVDHLWALKGRGHHFHYVSNCE